MARNTIRVRGEHLTYRQQKAYIIERSHLLTADGHTFTNEEYSNYLKTFTNQVRNYERATGRTRDNLRLQTLSPARLIAEDLRRRDIATNTGETYRPTGQYFEISRTTRQSGYRALPQSTAEQTAARARAAIERQFRGIVEGRSAYSEYYQRTRATFERLRGREMTAAELEKLLRDIGRKQKLDASAQAAENEAVEPFERRQPQS